MLKLLRFFTVAAAIVVPTAGAMAADGSLRELKADGHFWEGPVSEMRRVGLRQWAAVWKNNRGETRNLTISLMDGNQIDIFEQEPEQHWVGPYEISNGVYYAEGKERRDPNLTFGAVLPLP